MKHRPTRTAVSVAATLGLTLGATAIGAGTAHAVESHWGCTSLTPVYPPYYPYGSVSGTNCQGSGGGTGWFALEPIGMIEYHCSSFSAVEVLPPVPQAPYYDVIGTGCNAPGPE
jgi:hypothetical protein